MREGKGVKTNDKEARANGNAPKTTGVDRGRFSDKNAFDFTLFYLIL